MKERTIRAARRPLWGAFAVSALLVLLVGFALWNFERLAEVNRWNIHSYEVLQHADALSRALEASETDLRGFALTAAPVFLNETRQNDREALTALEELRDLTRDNETQQGRLTRFNEDYAAWRQKFEPHLATVANAREVRSVAGRTAAQTTARRQILQSLRRQIFSFQAAESRLLEKRRHHQRTSQIQTAWTLGVGSAFAVVLTFFLTALLGRSAARLAQTNAEFEKSNAGLQAEIVQRRAVERTLGESEERFRLLAEDSLDLICRLAPDGKFLYVSSASSPILGMRPAELVGKYPHDFVHPDDLEALAIHHRAVLATRKSASYVHRFRRHDGSYAWLESVTHGLFDPESNACNEIHITARDVTARRQNEERQNERLRNLRGLVAATDELLAIPDETTLLRRAVELSRENLGLERAGLFLLNSDEQSLRGTFGTTLEGQTSDERAVEMSWPAAWPGEEELEAKNQRWTLSESLEYKTLKDGRLATLPQTGWIAKTLIRAGEKVVGVLSNDAAISKAPFDAEKQEIVAVYASLLGTLLERQRAQEFLRQSEERLRTVVENAPILLYAVDKDGRYTLVTGKGLEDTGIQATALLGRPFFDVMATQPEVVEMMRRALEGESSVSTSHFNGRWFETWRQPLKGADGQFSGMLGVGVDVTERRTVEIALRENESRYRALVNSLQEVVFQTGSEGEWQFLNAAWTEILGYDIESSLGRAALQFVHPDDQSEFARLMTPLFDRRREAVQFVVRFLTQNGEERRIEIVARLLSDESGVPIGAAGTLNDISEQFRAQSELLRVSTLQNAILKGASYAIIATSPEGTIQSFNRAAEELVGWSSEEVVGRETPLIFHDSEEIAARAGDLSQQLDEPIAADWEVFTAVARRGVSDEFDWTWRKRDGKTLPVRLSISALRGKNEEITGFVAIAYDLTESRRVEKMKNEFISVVSHELRTPLTSIRGALGLLVGGVAGQLPAAAAQMLQIAGKNAERLVELINDILDVEKIESGQMRFVLSEISLVLVLENAVEANRAYAAGLEVLLEMEVPEELHAAKIEGDESRLMQVLANLISNACKFTPPGEKVTLRLAQTPRAWRVEVQDSGPGVPEAFVPRLFEKFAQADASSTRRQGGTGLGLAIARAIVLKHGGDLSYVAPDPPRRNGATFAFELPSRSAPVLAEGKTRPTILVCEDDANAAKRLREVLESDGFEVVVAPTLERARELLATEKFVGMTLDVLLPDGDGLSFLHDLRAAPATRHLPVVVVSMSQNGEVLNGDALKIVDWLLKPIEAERLLEAVRSFAQIANGGKARVLHVEDDGDILQVTAAILKEIAFVEAAPTLAEARRRLEKDTFDLVLLDIGLPDGSGLHLVPFLNARTPPTPVVLFSARETGEDDARQVAAALVKSRTSNTSLRETIRGTLAGFGRAANGGPKTR